MRSQRRTDGAPVRREASAERIPGTGPSAGAHRLLCGFAVVIVEQAAQSFATSHVPVETAHALVGFDQRVFQPLMISLSMIMTTEFDGGPPQRLFTEEDHPIQAFALDRQNKSLDVSVQIRRTVRQPNDVSSGVLEQVAKVRSELFVAVQDEELLAEQKAVDRSVRFRPTCIMNAPSGPGVIPPMCTFREESSMTTST